MTAPSSRDDLIARLETCARSDLNAILAWDAEAVAQQDTTGGPLNGMSVAIKDNLCTVGLPTTCGSRILEGYQSPYEATVVTRLRQGGGVVACKTNLDEFGMGSSTEHSAFGPCRHPTHPDRVPGGSSGGSAALVAAGVTDAALGSDTGGSVRQPAAFCGVVGFKPTYGRISRFGLVAFASSLDQVGVFGRSVDGVSRVLEIISGRDERDSTSHGTPIGPLNQPVPLTGLRIGLPVEYFPADLHPDVAAACAAVRDQLKTAGAQLVPVSLPSTPLAVATYYVIAPAEASANLARFDAVRYGNRSGHHEDYAGLIRASRAAGLGPEVRRRIVTGTYVLSAGYADAYYRRAQAVRSQVAEDFRAAFSQVDVLFAPTTPAPAFRLGERMADPVAMYQGDRFVVAANLAGGPALSIPIGRSTDGLPVGGQLMGAVGDDQRLLGIARSVERALEGAA